MIEVPDGDRGRPESDAAAAAQDPPVQAAQETVQLARMWLLQGVPPGALATVACEERRYTPGDVILREGDPPDGVFFVAAGRVHIYVASDDGDLLLNVLGPGECLGEMGVLDGESRSATASAATLAICYFVPTEEFLDLMDQQPDVVRRLLTLLAQRVRRLGHRAADLPGDVARIPQQSED
jgi:CRP-like cAMP-binding protein